MYEHRLVVNITGQPGTGKSSTIQEILQDEDLFPPQITISHLSVSGLIRKFALAKGLAPANRRDMHEAHAAMVADNELAVTDPILRRHLTYNLLLVDGLRVYAHAKYLKEALGDNFRTATLTAPDMVRYHRVFMRSVMDQQLPPTFGEFIAEGELDLGEDYRFPDVMDMHDLSATPIDTSAFTSPRETATHLTTLIRPYILL